MRRMATKPDRLLVAFDKRPPPQSQMVMQSQAITEK